MSQMSLSGSRDGAGRALLQLAGAEQMVSWHGSGWSRSRNAMTEGSFLICLSRRVVSCESLPVKAPIRNRGDLHFEQGNTNANQYVCTVSY